MDDGFDPALFAQQKRVKASMFARRYARGAFYSLSLSLVLAAGVGSVALASAVAFDVPQGTQTLARETSARILYAAHEIVASVGAAARTAQANIPRFDFGGDISYSRTAQTAQAASAYNNGFGSLIGRWLCRVFGNCGEAVVEEVLRVQNSQNVPTQHAPSALTSTAWQESATSTIINQYVTQPVVERTIERAAPVVAGVDEARLDSKLSILKNDLLSRISQISATGGTSYTPVYVNSPSGNFVSRELFDRQVDAIWNGIALTNRIDKLTDITLDGVTGLTDADVPDGITASNYLLLSGGSLTGAITNSATATSTFSGPFAASVLNISTTTATSTFASGIDLSGGCFAVNGTCITGGSGSSASSTLLSDSNTWSGVNTFNGNVTLANATSTNFSVSGTASSSALVASNSFTFKNVTGFLKATAGAVATALIDLAADVSGILPVGNGGTGWSNFASGAIPYGNGGSALATTSAGTAGQVLAFLNGVPTWTATTTFSSGLTYSGGNVTLDTSGNWSGTFDSQEGSYYLNAANLTNFGTPFYQFFSATTTTALAEGSNLYFTNNRVASVIAGTTTDALAQGATNKYYADSLAQSFIHSSTTIPKTYTANAFSALQSFDNASTTRLSIFDRLYVGGAATTTIFGNATSTFGAGLESTYLNITGTAATSTFANGIKFTGGCIEVGGTCIGGSSSQWTTSGSNIYFTTGSVLIGTTTPGRMLTVFNTAANAQQRISYDATRYAEFYVDASGDLQISATGKNLRALDANLYLCDGGACPTTPVQGYPSFTSQGNAVLAGTVYTTGIAPVTCPTGMIPVPPMPEVGMYNGFCVDKYEAKSNAGNQESVAAGTPWVSITQYNAIAECRRAGKHLITEPEWMAIARNVEDVGWNWNGGVAGTNQMSDGHSDNSPANSLAADVTGDPDDDPCVGTGQTCSTSTWNSQRRTYQLSNGSYIWDFAGNVWEWVDQANQEDYPVANSGTAGWQTCSTSGDGICGNTRTTNDQWYRGASTALRGFLRGGNWFDGANDGAFALNLLIAPGDTFTSVGFRCAR